MKKAYNNIGTKNYSKRLKKVHPELILLSEYLNNKYKVMVADKWGVRLAHPQNLLSTKSHVPSIKTAVNKTDYFKSWASDVHKHEYTYGKSIYVNAESKLIITCPIHGDFEQIANVHTGGHGCPKCAYDFKYSGTGWDRESYISAAKGRECTLYILKCFNKKEVFLKIGITCKSVSSRYNTKKSMPYNYIILKEVKGSAEYIWCLENKLHTNKGLIHYKPCLVFQGHTECYSINKEILKVVRKIN